MGPQWPGMGSDLYHKEKDFKKIINQCDEIFNHFSGQSFINYFDSGNPLENEKNVIFLQATNLALQIAITQLWKERGVIPHAVVGHSVGEVGAAYTAEILSVEQAFFITWHRSRLQKHFEMKGAMLAIELSFQEAKALFSPKEWVEIAAINDSESLTLVGDKKVLNKISLYASQKNVFNRFLRTNIPYHSILMDKICKEFVESISSLEIKQPQKKIYSSVTGTKMNQEWGVHYWWNNIRSPVNFKDAIEQILKDGYRCFIEISPHPTLVKSLERCIQEGNYQGDVFCSINRKYGAVKSLFSSSSD